MITLKLAQYYKRYCKNGLEIVVDNGILPDILRNLSQSNKELIDLLLTPKGELRCNVFIQVDGTYCKHDTLGRMELSDVVVDIHPILTGG